MNRKQSAPSADANEEISALIETLFETEQRLEELTGGEVDTVAGRDGRTFMLRRAQEQSRDSEAGKQAAILNVLPAHIALLDAQGTIVSVNEAWRRFANANVLHAPGPGLGLNYLEICDRAQGDYSTEAQQVAAGIRSVLGRGQKSFSIEYPCHSPTEQRWFLLTVTPLSDDRANGAVVMHLNITERKRSEEKQRASELEFRSMAESMPQMVWMTRPDGWTTYVNQRWVDYSGLSFEESLGHGWGEVFHPDDQQLAAESWQRAVAVGTDHITECRIRRADGTYRWMLIRGVAVRDQAGLITKWMGTCTDIDDLKRAGAALRESEEMLRGVMESSHDCIKILDREGRLLWMNEGGQKIMEIDDFAVVDRQPWTSFWPPDEQAAAMAALERGRNNHVGKFTGSCPTAKGSPRWWEVVITPMLNDTGFPEKLLSVSRDITERKQAEVETQRLHRQLVDASRQAGMAEVATSVLHNVGNVLNSVNVSCSLILGKVRQSRISSVAKTAELLNEHAGDLTEFLTNDQTGKKIPEYLGKLAVRLAEEQKAVLDEVQLLTGNIEHIKDIINVQQSHARNIGGVRETLPIEGLVEEALRMNDGVLRRHRIKVTREFAEVPMVSMEKHKVLQILVNLIRNAKHALTDGGGQDKQLILRIGRNNGNVVVSVSDNGIGIPAENMTRIFGHGFTTKKDGHGFGLHSGALAAQEMGGSLAAESDGPGTGATFTLSLPLDGHGNN